MKTYRVLTELLHDDHGATMVEYGIMVALIAAVCVVLVSTLGHAVSTKFSSLNANL